MSSCADGRLGGHRGCRCRATAQVGAQAQTKITVGKVVGGVGLHIPSYIAMDKGFFKDEGLDARFVELAGRPLMTAGLTGNVDFIPIPSGGAQAVLKRRASSATSSASR